MESQTLYLNRVVIPHLRLLYDPRLIGMENVPGKTINGVPVYVMKNISLWVSASMQTYADVLFSQSAEKIYVVSSDERAFAQDAADLAPVAKSRIELADQKGKL